MAPCQTYCASTKDLPCAQHPCDPTPIPQYRYPRGINATFWNQIRYREIKAMRRFPTANRCRLFEPAIQSCSVTQNPADFTSTIQLAYNKSQCDCAKVITPTLIRITDPVINKIEWSLGPYSVLQTLYPGENLEISIEQQKILSKPDVVITVTYNNDQVLTFNSVCFDARAEFYSFYLEEFDPSTGCTKVIN